MRYVRYMSMAAVLMWTVFAVMAQVCDAKECYNVDVGHEQNSAVSSDQTNTDFPEGARDNASGETSRERDAGSRGMSRSDFGSGSADDPDKSD